MTDTLRKAAELALEVLEESKRQQITALRTALAEKHAEVEPVAYLWENGEIHKHGNPLLHTTPLYSEMQAALQERITKLETDLAHDHAGWESAQEKVRRQEEQIAKLEQKLAIATEVLSGFEAYGYDREYCVKALAEMEAIK